MEEVDRLHQAYEKTDDVAETRNAAASAQAQLQQAREKALLEGGPTPEELEAERQRKGIRIQRLLAQGVPGEEIEAALAEEDAKLAGRDKRAPREPVMTTDPEFNDPPTPHAGSLQDALGAAVTEALEEDGLTAGEWSREGQVTISWGIAKAADHDGAQIGFAVQVAGEDDPGMILLDLDEKRLDGWSRGLQNADGPRRFAFGITSKVFEVAGQQVSQLLLGAIHEVQEGLHLPGAADPRPHYDPALHSVDPPEAEDEAPPMSAEARAFLLRNAEQGEPEVVSYGPSPEELEATGAAAQAAIEEAMKEAEDA